MTPMQSVGKTSSNFEKGIKLNIYVRFSFPDVYVHYFCLTPNQGQIWWHWWNHCWWSPAPSFSGVCRQTGQKVAPNASSHPWSPGLCDREPVSWICSHSVEPGAAPALTDVRQAGGIGDGLKRFEAAALHSATRRWGEALNWKPRASPEAALRDLMAARALADRHWVELQLILEVAHNWQVLHFDISWRRKKPLCLWVVSEGTESLWIWLISYTVYLLLLSCTYCSSFGTFDLSELSYTFLSIHELECLYKTGTSSCYKRFSFPYSLRLRSQSQRTLC